MTAMKNTWITVAAISSISLTLLSCHDTKKDAPVADSAALVRNDQAPPPPPFMMPVSAMKDQLGLSEAQVARIQAIRDSSQQAMQNQPRPEDRAVARDQFRRHFDEMNAQIETVLTPEQ